MSSSAVVSSYSWREDPFCAKESVFSALTPKQTRQDVNDVRLIIANTMSSISNMHAISTEEDKLKGSEFLFDKKCSV